MFQVKNQTLVVLYEVSELVSLKTLMTFQTGVGISMDFSHQSKVCVCVCVLSIHSFINLYVSQKVPVWRLWHSHLTIAFPFSRGQQTFY